MERDWTKEENWREKKKKRRRKGRVEGRRNKGCYEDQLTFVVAQSLLEIGGLPDGVTGQLAIKIHLVL